MAFASFAFADAGSATYSNPVHADHMNACLRASPASEGFTLAGTGCSENSDGPGAFFGEAVTSVQAEVAMQGTRPLFTEQLQCRLRLVHTRHDTLDAAHDDRPTGNLRHT